MAQVLVKMCSRVNLPHTMEAIDGKNYEIVAWHETEDKVMLRGPDGTVFKPAKFIGCRLMDVQAYEVCHAYWWEDTVGSGYDACMRRLERLGYSAVQADEMLVGSSSEYKNLNKAMDNPPNG